MGERDTKFYQTIGVVEKSSYNWYSIEHDEGWLVNKIYNILVLLRN